MPSRLRKPLLATALLFAAGCAQSNDKSGLMWYRKPPKATPKGNTIDVGRVNNPSSFDLVAAPEEATNSNDTGADIQRGGGGGLAIGNIADHPLQGDAAAANHVTGPSVGGGVDTTVSD